MIRHLFALLALSFPLLSNEAPTPYSHIEDIPERAQTFTVQGKELSYKVHVGRCFVPGKDETKVAPISYFAYIAENSKDRPIAFCFNGGPGSSSIWLHMGVLGPKIVKTDDLYFPTGPGQYENNPDSLLSLCDLVFIDPVSTGYSHAATPEEETPFHEVENDAYSVANFIRLFLSLYNKWSNPKLIIGESYGTMRAIVVTRLLQENYFININALGLVSLCLNAETSDFHRCTPTALVTALPTLATIAHYHKALSPSLLEKSAQEIFDKAADFAVYHYSPALFATSQLPKEKEEKIAQKLSDFTSIPTSTIKQQHLRLTPQIFCQQFLDKQNLKLGGFDARIAGWKIPQAFVPYYLPDPSVYTIASSFSSAFHAYLLNDLHYKENRPYTVLADVGKTWKWPEQQPFCGYSDFSNDLRQCFCLNPKLQIMVAAGLYDLATPAFGQKYSIDNLFLPEQQASNISFTTYEAGHMMYTHPPSREKFCANLRQLIEKACSKGGTQ